MSVHFITGKPRGGKSYYSMRLLRSELLHGSRPIVTNLPVVMSELNAYLQRAYPEKEIDLSSRIQLLKDEELGEFWLRRGPGRELLRLEGSGSKRDPFKMDTVEGGVFYILDEVHITFGARQWMETGPKVLYYLSQHAKLGDDVVCVTQALELVDKQFRKLAQDFTVVTNQGKRQLMGFRMPKFFTRRTYDQPPGPTATVMVRGTFDIDVEGLAACYNTASGVGVLGREADKTARLSGRPFWQLPVVIILCVIGIVMGLIAAGKAVTTVATKAIVGAPVSVAQAIEPLVSHNSPEVAQQPTSISITAAPLELPEKRYLVGMSPVGSGRYILSLSDGETIDSSQLKFLSKEVAVTLNDEVLHWEKRTKNSKSNKK